MEKNVILQPKNQGSFLKLLELLFHPIRFFEQNRDGEEELLRFAVFIIRVSIVIEAVGLLFFISFTPQGFLLLAGVSVALWFFSALIGSYFAGEFGHAVNFLTKKLGGKDDALKGKRVSVYNMAFFALLLHSYLILLIADSLVVLGIFYAVVIPLSFIWQTIGIAKQYQFSWGRAFFISTSPFFVFFGAMILIIGWPLYIVGCDSSISEVFATGGKCFLQ